MAYIFHNKMVYTLTVRTGGISVVTSLLSKEITP